MVANLRWRASQIDWPIERVAAIGVFVLVLAIRAFHLDDASMWEDEAFRYDLALGDRTHFVASHAGPNSVYENTGQPKLGSVTDVLTFLHDQSPYAPLYFLSVHGLMAGGAREPATIALFNATCAAITGVVLFLMSRTWLPVGSALAAPILFAFSPWDIGVSMQLKETALATTLGWSATLFLLRKRFSAYGLSLGAALLVQQMSLFWFALHALWIALNRQFDRNTLRRCAKAWSIAVALYVPWLLYAGSAQLSHLRRVNELFGGKWAGIRGLPQGVATYFDRSIAPLGPGGSWSEWALVAILCLLVAMSFRSPLARLGTTLWLGALLLSIATYLVMRQNQALWPRYSPIFLPGAWLSIAGIFERGRERWVAAHQGRRAQLGSQLVVAGAAVALGVVLLPRPLKPLFLDRATDWRPIAEALATRVLPGDIIVHQVGYNAFDAFIHLWPERTRHIMMDSPSPEDRQRVKAMASRVWLVLSWGQQADAANWQRALGGWERVDVSWPAPNPGSEGGIAPASRSRTPNAVRVVGFIPPALSSDQLLESR